MINRAGVKTVAEVSTSTDPVPLYSYNFGKPKCYGGEINDNSLPKNEISKKIDELVGERYSIVLIGILHLVIMT